MVKEELILYLKSEQKDRKIWEERLKQLGFGELLEVLNLYGSVVRYYLLTTMKIRSDSNRNCRWQFWFESERIFMVVSNLLPLTRSSDQQTTNDRRTPPSSQARYDTSLSSELMNRRHRVFARPEKIGRRVVAVITRGGGTRKIAAHMQRNAGCDRAEKHRY